MKIIKLKITRRPRVKIYWADEQDDNDNIIADMGNDDYADSDDTEE